MSHNARIVAALVAKGETEFAFARLARAYARAHGHHGTRSVSEDYAAKMQRKILNWATRQLTAFRDFADMVNAWGGYRPTMRIDRDWRFLPLAGAYDAHQARVGDPRRAERAMPL